MGKFYVTTAIHYANAKPHIGHCFENLLADVYARYHRLRGDKTFFLTGTDEHGLKVKQKAQASDMSVQAFVDETSEYFRKMNLDFDYSNDYFIRTTDDLHKKFAQEWWLKMVAAGDIYKDSYEGLYCVGSESFILEKDLDENGNVPHYGVPPVKVQEENYFFKLSKYQDKLLKLLESGDLKILPDYRAKEIINIVKDGLHDVSFSRPKASLDWGIPVPNDPEHVMYVWSDALTNYLTGLQINSVLDDYWSASHHVIGKDILKFHAIYWPCMLMSMGLSIPSKIFVHGMITKDGVKMSKSLGNIVDPYEVKDIYGVDALRYFLCREIPTGEDGDFDLARFKVVYESELANNFGNLLNRTVSMTNRYLNGSVVALKEFEFEEEFADTQKNIDEAFDDFDLKKVTETIMHFASSLNQYVEDKKPWALNKESKTQELEIVLANLLEGIRRVNILLAPFIPNKSQQVLKMLGLKDYDSKFESGHKLSDATVLFPRVEV